MPRRPLTAEQREERKKRKAAAARRRYAAKTGAERERRLEQMRQATSRWRLQEQLGTPGLLTSIMRAEKREKRLAQAREAASMPAEEFEKHVAQGREAARRHASNRSAEERARLLAQIKVSKQEQVQRRTQQRAPISTAAGDSHTPSRKLEDVAMPRRHVATDTTQFQRAQQNEDGQLTTREHATAVLKASSAITRQAHCHDKAGGQSPQASDLAEHKSSQGLMDLAPVHGHFNLRVPVTSQMAAKVKFSEKRGSRKLNVSVVEAALRRSGLTRPLSDYAIVFVPNASMANPVKLDASDGTPAVCNKRKQPGRCSRRGNVSVESAKAVQTEATGCFPGRVDVAVGTSRIVDRDVCKSTQTSLAAEKVHVWTQTVDLDAQDSGPHVRKISELSSPQKFEESL
ncbi:uncharacterized protein LOC142564151 isoform X1 [Dermacentor variabilis]|uniref:uncharacterized protein LOC142564151 isoform X1 n=1 Tax=Dermacentor variabilis TaxID=34621 RepID=UPI003F5AEBD9